VLSRLADTFGALSDLEALESVTSGRQEAQQKGVPGISPGAMATGYGYTYVNAAFSYPRPSGSRFNTTSWGAWYCALSVETSLAEISFHLTRALEAAGGEFDNETRYIELICDLDAEFLDIREPANPPHECLDSDTAVGYPNGQALASNTREKGLNGIIYPSVRHHGGTCVVAFWPGLIQNFQQGNTWILSWQGNPTPIISKLA
jgi:RES domain-containing protein